MKFAFTLLLLSVNVTSAWAWKVHSEISIGSKGEFQDSVTLFCRPDETLCQQVCGNSSSCWKEQELCYNCLGTSNPVLRVVFTEVDRLYQNTNKLVVPSAAISAFQKDHIFVAARSIYNFYSAVDSAEILLRFQSLCQSKTTNPMVVLGKNAQQEPNQIKYIICDSAAGYSQDMYILAYSPQVQKTIPNLQLKQP